MWPSTDLVARSTERTTPRAGIPRRSCDVILLCKQGTLVGAERISCTQRRGRAVERRPCRSATAVVAVIQRVVTVAVVCGCMCVYSYSDHPARMQHSSSTSSRAACGRHHKKSRASSRYSAHGTSQRCVAPAAILGASHTHGCDTGTEHAAGMARRLLLGAGVAATAGLSELVLPGAAAALKTITLRDGTSVEVYEHGMSLGIVSLKGSVPSDWILQYKMALGAARVG